MFTGVGLVKLNPIAIGALIGNRRWWIDTEQARTNCCVRRGVQWYRFRSVVENAESEAGVCINKEDAGGVDSRITRVGRISCQTYIVKSTNSGRVLRGNMSAFGPRPECTELDTDIQSSVTDWQ